MQWFDSEQEGRKPWPETGTLHLNIIKQSHQNSPKAVSSFKRFYFGESIQLCWITVSMDAGFHGKSCSVGGGWWLPCLSWGWENRGG